MTWILSLWTLFKSSRTAQVIALVLALAAATLMVDRCAKRVMTSTVTTATEKGRADQRADDLQEAIRQTERANNAAETIRRDPDARRADCLRDSRTPENC